MSWELCVCQHVLRTLVPLMLGYCLHINASQNCNGIVSTSYAVKLAEQICQHFDTCSHSSISPLLLNDRHGLYMWKGLNNHTILTGFWHHPACTFHDRKWWEVLKIKGKDFNHAVNPSVVVVRTHKIIIIHNSLCEKPSNNNSIKSEYWWSYELKFNSKKTSVCVCSCVCVRVHPIFHANRRAHKKGLHNTYALGCIVYWPCIF